MAGYCKWTKGCTNPGPWLAWMDGAFYECTEPNKATRAYDKYAEFVGKVNELHEQVRLGQGNRENEPAQALLREALTALCYEKPQPLYCVPHAREFQRIRLTNTTGQITEDGEQRNYDGRANPLLLFCRKSIDKSIDDAKETDPVTGEPTDDAMLSRFWLEYRPDHKDEEDFCGSFEWCCHWLSLDVATERKDAIEEIEDSLARRLLAVKRVEWDRRKHDVLYRAMATQEQAAIREAQMAAVKRAQLVMEF
jgi:hypothetical protein